jgi:hemoglobin
MLSKDTSRRVNGFHYAIAAAALALGAATPAPGQDHSGAGSPPSLYARLGGYDFIARFVDTAFPRVAGHSQLHRFFQGHAQDSQVRQRQLIIDALCQAAGGPCAYTGREMKTVHTGLGITSEDWTVFVGILSGTLDELKVAASERKDFLELLERRFRPEVVEAH